jgi:DNA gyrase subunit A
MSEYNVTRNVGLKALTLDDGDEIVNVLFTDNEKVGIVTEGGNFLMIATEDIRPIGRVAKGVKAIKLNDGDGVASARIIPADTTMIASISGNGLFKKTGIDEFVIQGRGTKGAKIQKLNDGDWIADFYPIVKDGDILVASTHACIKLTTNDIPIFSKGALGNKSIKLNPKDNVVGISIY